jgi:hypothetical protein
MSRSIAVVACLAMLLLLPSAARAQRLTKGHSLVTVAVGGHRGQFVEAFPPVAGFPGALFGEEIGEVGGEIGYYRFLSDQWTLGLSGGYHASRSKPDGSGIEGAVESHSFTVRIGGDRYAFIDDKVALYAGPGVVFTRGRVKFDLEEPEATEIGLNGRIGMYARLAKGWALVGHIGQVLSHTSAKADFGSISLWNSTHEGSVGLALDF